MSYLMMDLAGLTVSDKEAQQLQHPQVGGVILFSRNYQSKSQLMALTAAIRLIRAELVIAVDHEGGRVQRFVSEFTKIPAMGHILPNANNDLKQACEWATELGFVMAIELLACDIDLSFAPVLDINGVSDVIGLRSFSDKPEHITQLANAWINGMNDAGMSAVGKHFPGHGNVKADSHVAMAVDSRSKKAIFANDVQPFKALIEQQKLAGVMPAHVVYDQVDPNPAGFSSHWLQNVLRQDLGFDGVIFSDDLGMKGASFAGDYVGRAQAALNAGCNMILVCNDPEGVETLLTEFNWPQQAPHQNAGLLRADQIQVAWALEQTSRWQQGQELANKLVELNQ